MMDAGMEKEDVCFTKDGCIGIYRRQIMTLRGIFRCEYVTYLLVFVLNFCQFSLPGDVNCLHISNLFFFGGLVKAVVVGTLECPN